MSDPQPTSPQTVDAWSPTGVIGEAWEKVKNDPAGLILPVVLVSVIQGLPNGVLSAGADAMTREGNDVLAAALRFSAWLVGLVISAWLTGGLMELFLKAARSQPYTVSDVFGGGRWFAPMLVTLFLVQLGTSVGFLLCVIPGIVLALGWVFATVLVVDRERSAVDAIKESWALTRGHKMDIFVFWILGFFVGLLGLLACCVGIFPAMAVVLLAQIHIYEHLSAASDASPPPTVF